ncbi:MAG: DUF3179 domain-containing protein [Gemmatimonadota bacterium]|nr:MAG: DUF3179 domain-containing protein [Gemmatimonadota bacterium]
MINGETHHFEFIGLYDGVSILRDRETGGYWHHITGQCLYGPLAGARLAGLSNLLHLSVDQALNVYDHLEIAVSDRPIRGTPSRWWPLAESVPALPDRLRNTMAGEDTRRSTMDVGLGVWNQRIQRYYPMESIAASDDYVIDEFDGRRLLVYFDPAGHALSALYTRATSAEWRDKDLVLDTGEFIHGGVLHDPQGSRLVTERPMQLFTRWYGYALTFPTTEIFTP